jgi:outer membrane protein assembly factor BamB
VRRALGVLLLGLVACSPSAPAPVQPADSWTVELSTAPTLLLLTEDAVLAASYGNGVGGSQVYRVDRASGRLVQQRTVAGQPNGMALGPDGELWLATLQLPDQSTGTGLQVLDPVTLQTRRSVPVEGVPLSIAFVDGALWTGDASGLRRLDLGTGAVLAGDRLWVTDPQGGRLLCLDPVSGAVRDEWPVGTTGPVVADASGVVVAQPAGAALVPAECPAED